VDDVLREQVARGELRHDPLGRRQERGGFAAGGPELRRPEEVTRVVVD
jgi:hypothetical protein